MQLPLRHPHLPASMCCTAQNQGGSSRAAGPGSRQYRARTSMPARTATATHLGSGLRSSKKGSVWKYLQQPGEEGQMTHVCQHGIYPSCCAWDGEDSHHTAAHLRLLRSLPPVWQAHQE